MDRLGRADQAAPLGIFQSGENGLVLGVDFGGTGEGGYDGGGDYHCDEGKADQKIMHWSVLLLWGSAVFARAHPHHDHDLGNEITE